MSATALFLAALTMFLSVWLFTQQQTVSAANCLRIHTLTMTLDKMIADSVQSLKAYRDDGTITRGQYDREVVRIGRQRDQLGGADCPPRRVLP